MAISLPYYFGLTDLTSGVISDAWYEPATVEGNFLINSTGNFKRQINNSGQDFTFIATIDKAASGAMEVLAGSNWTFGIDAANFFFIQSNLGEAYTFNDINLGKKTLFSLEKNGSAFSLTTFNVPSQAVERSQTQFFGPANDLTGTGLYFAGGNAISGVKNFYGTVDQMLLLNQPISDASLNSLFSGFLQQTVTYGTPTSSWILSYINWEATGSYSQAQLNNLVSGANEYAVDLFSYFAASLSVKAGYYGEMGVKPTGTANSLDTTPFVNPCTTFGLSQVGTSAFTGNFTAPVFINYYTPNSLLAFDFSALNPGMGLDLTYTLTTQESTSVARNTGYYSGFVMNGANAPNATQLTLSYFPTGMQFISQLGRQDLISSKYYAPGAIPGTIYLDGYPWSSYNVIGSYIILNDTGNINQLIYDKKPQSLRIPLQTGTENFATGNFFPKTSVAFTGGLRTLDYLETHQYHLYYSKAVPSGQGFELYANTDTNWQ